MRLHAGDLRRAMTWGFAPGVEAELGVVSDRARYFWSSPIVDDSGSFLDGAQTGGQGCQPVAVAPWPTDNAGVAFPAGSVLALAGVHSTAFAWKMTIQNNVEIVDQFQELNVLSRSHRGRYLFIIGAIPGTTCTLVVRRYGYWLIKSSGGAATTIETITIDGDDGAVQVIQLDDITVPDDAAEPHGIYYTATWSGTAAHRLFLARAPRTTHGAMVVPDTIPAGFTATSDSGESLKTYALGRQRRTRDNVTSFSLCGMGLLNNHLVRDMTNNGYRTAYLANGDTREPRRGLGMPDTVRDRERSTNFVGPDNPVIMPPRIWINNVLREMTYWPAVIGPRVAVASPSIGAFGFSETITEVSGWLNWNAASSIDSVGPGWRNIRLYVLRKDLGAGATIDNATFEWRINGGPPQSRDITSMNGDGVTADFVDITAGLLPSSPQMDALIEYRLSITVTFASTDATGATIYLRLYLSPRVDIPCPWTMPGRGVTTAPGAYLDGSLTDPSALGGVLHVDAGLTSVEWTIAGTITGESQSRVISFVPPAVGYWRIKPPANFNATLGEYQDRLTGAAGEIGRPGKRFYGRVVSSSLASINGTWTLEALTPTYHAIAAAGTQVTTSTLTPLSSGMFFGTIALPAAGTYRIRTRVTGSAFGGISYRIFLSLTDAFCAVPALADQTINAPLLLTGTWISAADPPGAPTTGMLRRIIAPATGEWAGREGQVAFRLPNRWVYYDPSEHPQVADIDGTWSISAGQDWSTLADQDLTSQTVTVDAAATLYVRMVRADDEFTATPLPPIGGPTIYWEAV